MPMFACLPCVNTCLSGWGESQADEDFRNFLSRNHVCRAIATSFIIPSRDHRRLCLNPDGRETISVREAFFSSFFFDCLIPSVGESAFSLTACPNLSA